jgi:hypothetical protein
MDRSVRKRRIGIIALWLVWAILMSVVFYAIEDRIIWNEARKEILDQANTIAEQLPALGENHFYAKVGAAKSQFDKLKALSPGPWTGKKTRKRPGSCWTILPESTKRKRL